MRHPSPTVVPGVQKMPIYTYNSGIVVKSYNRCQVSVTGIIQTTDVSGVNEMPPFLFQRCHISIAVSGDRSQV